MKHLSHTHSFNVNNHACVASGGRVQAGMELHLSATSGARTRGALGL